MEKGRLTRVSKYLSKYLHHRPQDLGLKLEPGGWVGVDALLAASARRGFRVSRSELEEVVVRNDKRRFAFDESGDRIRAQQGHSVPVDLGLAPADPPPVLYHGTGERSAGNILSEGLWSMRRHHVHLSSDSDTASAVGGRHGKPVVLVVAAGAMRDNGWTFYRSGNDVWLVDRVPPEYLQLPRKCGGLTAD